MTHLGCRLQDVLSSERPSILHEWMNSPKSELTSFLSASSLFSDCNLLFTPSSLLWAAACEPLRALTHSIERCESDRRQVLHERVALTRSETETALALPSRDERVPSLPRASPTSMFEYLWFQWKEKEPTLQKDLQRVLPLPRFLEANLDSSSLLLFEPTAQGMKRDLAQHVVLAIVTAVTLVRLPSKEAPDGDLVMSNLLDMLFDLHAFEYIRTPHPHPYTHPPTHPHTATLHLAFLSQCAGSRTRRLGRAFEPACAEGFSVE